MSSIHRVMCAFPDVECSISLSNQSLYARCALPHLSSSFTGSCRLVEAQIRKAAIGVESCRSQGWNCGGLSSGRYTSISTEATSSYPHGIRFHSATLLTWNPSSCFATNVSKEAEAETAQPEGGETCDKATIYDSLETRRITVDLFPELNFTTDGNFYPKLVPLLARRINHLFDEVGGEDRIPDLLQYLGLKLTPHVVAEVLKLQKYEPRKAQRFFKWAGGQAGFEHNSHTYNIKLWILVNLKDDVPGRVVLSLIHLEKMLAKNLKPEALGCNVLICRLCKDGKVGAALKLARALERKDFPDVVTFNSLITGLGKARRFKEVFELLDEMEQKGCTPDIVTYNSLINLFSKAGLFKEVFGVLHAMVQKGCPPDLVTYNAVIHGLGNAGQWQEARKVFDELSDKEIVPDVVTYNSLISGLFKGHKVEEAYKILDLMRSRNCEPNEVTYNTLIDGLLKCSRLEEAWKTFDSMHHMGLKLNEITYNTMIGGLISHGKLDDALRLLTKMKENGCTPDAITYRMLGVYLDESLEFCDEVKKSSSGMEVNPAVAEDFSEKCLPGRSDHIMDGEWRPQYLASPVIT